MEEEEYVGPPADLMSLRAGMMVHIAESIKNDMNRDAKHMLLMAMECLLYTINPPRGEVVEVPRHH